MVELGRALTAQADAATAAAAAAPPSAARAPPPAPPSEAAEQLLAAEGLAALRLLKVRREAARVFRLRDATSRVSEWPHIQSDLLALARPGVAPAAKLELHRAMLRDYALLQA